MDNSNTATARKRTRTPLDPVPRPQRTRSRVDAAEPRAPAIVKSVTRDPKTGRLLPGSRLAVGRSNKTESIRSQLAAAVTPSDIYAIARKLIADSRAGSSRAQRILLGYLLGKPRPMPTPRHDAIDGLPDVAGPGGPRAFVAAIVARTAAGEIGIDTAERLVSLLRVGAAAEPGPEVNIDMRGANLSTDVFAYI